MGNINKKCVSLQQTLLYGRSAQRKAQKCGSVRITKNSKTMGTFIGNIVIKADDKGRIFIPAAYRKILTEIGSERIVMRRDTDNACLVLYPETVWNKKVEELSGALDEWNPEDQMLLMQFVADAEYLEFDNQGRVLLQKRNLQSINAGSELLIVGMMSRFAIWDRETFAAKRMEQGEFATLLRKKMSRQQTEG